MELVLLQQHIRELAADVMALLNRLLGNGY